MRPATSDSIDEIEVSNCNITLIAEDRGAGIGTGESMSRSGNYIDQIRVSH
jgi:hypothetical protein